MEMTRVTGGLHFIGLLDGKAGAYGVVFPDAPGCAAMGKTIEEAMRNAAVALGEWLSDGPAEQVRDAEALRQDAEVKEQLEAGSVMVVVPAVVESGRSVRANISLDAGLMQAIDAAARQAGVTRSAFLGSAARDKILSRI